MKMKWNRQHLIVAILSLIFVFMLESKTHAITETKLLAPDGAENDFFGESVSISGDVALVGAYANDDNGTNSGSAYVFRWNGSSWVQEQKLLASDGAPDDYFGQSVSISGDVALIGADQMVGNRTGAAYVFRWNGSSWVQEQKILASDGAGGDRFGESVSINGDVALVGAFSDDDYGERTGSAYVFRWNGSSWVEEQKLLASDGAEGDQFGQSVSISGDVAIVGAYRDDDNGESSGSAYIFRWNGSSWVQEQKILASEGDADDRFGESVCIEGGVALVGAYNDRDNDIESGSAYVFRWDGSSWIQEQKLLASDGAPVDYFSRRRVSISGNMALIGAGGNDDNGTNSGSAYVYNFLISEIQISIDIKPWACPNDYPIKGGGSVEVAILGTAGFDVTDIDIASVRLEGVPPTKSSLKDKSTPYIPAYECDCTADGKDGEIDLCLKFDKKAIITAIETELGGVVDVDTEYPLTLSGELNDGTPIEGQDCIVFVKKGKKD